MDEDEAFLTECRPLSRDYQCLPSSCVTIEDRIDPEKQRGVYPPKLRGKGDYAGDLRKVPCHYESEEHIAADQIFPLIKTEYWYTPTIKHHCPRCALASTLRACSNKVSFDPLVFDRYSTWFRKTFIPRWLKCIDQDLWNVDIESWLKKYNKGYRNKMMKTMHQDHENTLDRLSCIYEAFTKVEMQFTTVPHSLKETILNEVKERQICGPTDEKKVWGNPFINLLEEIASKHFKPYCGRANWMEICKSLQEGEDGLGQHVWGASDGSGFDMTQYPEMNELMNELLEASAYHRNVNWIEPLSIDKFLAAIKGSIKLNVSVDHGGLTYQAVGRASGDGWTTFGNTMLMVSYWAYTMEVESGISNYVLKVKGDDVLFALDVCDVPKLKKGIDVVFTTRKDEHTHGLGQICKKIDWGDLSDLDFLSNEFFRTGQGNWRMTRIPARVLQTLSWTTKLPKDQKTEKIRQELCYSKGMCLKAWAAGLPIWDVLAKKMISLGRKGKHSEFDQYSDGDRVWHQDRDDYDAYLQYLETRYGITAGEVAEVEREISKINSLKGFVHLPQLEKFYSRI